MTFFFDSYSFYLIYYSCY